MKVKLQPEEYIISALNEIPEALDYILLLVRRCDGDIQALGVDIYNWLHRASCQRYLFQDRIQAAIKGLPNTLLTEEEVNRMSRYNFFSELLKYALHYADSNALGEYYSKKYSEFRRTNNHLLKDEAGADPFGVS